MTAPRFLADEMVGRLARYLRFAGCDTLYVHGVSDAEIVARLQQDPRTLVTRDRALAARVPESILLTSGALPEQWRQLRTAVPGVPADVRFERCTLCNGALERSRVRPDEVAVDGVPWDRVRTGLELYSCTACGHLYWEGSHTARMRATFARWSETDRA